MSSVKRLVPLHALELETDPLNARKGDLYFNSIDQKLKFFDGTQWAFVGSGAVSGVLEHVHTYDGMIYSVGNTEYFDDGSQIIDGGIA